MKQKAIRALRQIPGVGISTAKILQDIGINSVDDLKGKTPEALLEQANEFLRKRTRPMPALRYPLRGVLRKHGTERPGSRQTTLVELEK